MVGPAKQALSYGLLIYGSESGYLSSRAQIELNGPGNTAGTSMDGFQRGIKFEACVIHTFGILEIERFRRCQGCRGR